MNITHTLSALLVAAAAMLAVPVSAQFPTRSDTDFDASKLEKIMMPSFACTGFWKTPSFKCVPIQVPTYLARAKGGDRSALVLISHGAGPVDKRHSEYARHMAENGINAMVMAHWIARGMVSSGGDYQIARAKGGDAVNWAIDALAILAQLKQTPEWKDAKVGYLGESMGGAAAINVTRPYIEAIVKERMNLPASGFHNFEASVGLYPACIDRSDVEGFKKVPLLLVSGEKDDITPPATCETQTKWMNARGGDVALQVLPGENHDWDAPTYRKHVNYENTSKCSNTRVGNVFVLESNGKEYPGTPEGFRAMRNDCRTYGFLMGNRGNEKAGFDVWTKYLSDKLLPAGNAK
jgi:dienelactone hydrolase